MIDSEKNKEIIELLRTSFAPKAAFQSSVLFDRNAGQDLDDTAFFLTFDPSNSNAKDAMLHGTYALSYFSFDALRRFLPELMIASLHNRFSYQPIIDAIVLGASSLKNGWGRHLEKLSNPERSAILGWFNLLETSARYDSYEIAKAMNSIRAI